MLYYVNRRDKVRQAKCKVLAYRVAPEEDESVMGEGFDDSGEEGAGEKLLHLL